MLLRRSSPGGTAPGRPRPRHTILDKCFAPIVPFLNERFAHIKPVTLNGGASIGTHTDLREARDLACQLLRLLASAPPRGDVFAQTNVQTLFRRYFPPCEDDF